MAKPIRSIAAPPNPKASSDPRSAFARKGAEKALFER